MEVLVLSLGTYMFGLDEVEAKKAKANDNDGRDSPAQSQRNRFKR